MKTIAALCALLVAMPVVAQEKKKADPQVERGRYLVQIGGCNDCHTPATPAAARCRRRNG